ncbi:MAG: mannuronate-specific alginate lyase [Sinimarinibacterium flocculans]|uniref:mannuronate-specific alginate lyase n=1 Tax=Sinimarinibacterium flocculans TaxID=985250 RepID=UPI003C514AFC
MRMLLAVAFCAAFPTLWLWSTASSAAPLRPPVGFTVAVGDDDKDLRDCPQDAVPFAGALDFPSKYAGSDRARDDYNARSDREYKRRIAPITAFERGVSRQVDDYMRGGRPEALDCAIGLLADWSRERGLEGRSLSHTGKSMRKWALGSVAASYLRLKFSASRPLDAIDDDRIGDIEAWIGRVAARVVDEWSDQPLRKMNNHEYWAAWSVMAAAVALDRKDLFDWAVAQYRTAATQIDAEGYLPNELARDTRALYYHNYALTPLAMLAAFGQANGVDLAAENDRAIDRLARRVLLGVADPNDFEVRTGAKQNVSEFKESSKFAWIEIYCWLRPCDAALLARLDTLRPLGSTRLGGSVTDLFSIPARHAGAAFSQEVSS